MLWSTAYERNRGRNRKENKTAIVDRKKKLVDEEVEASGTIKKD